MIYSSRLLAGFVFALSLSVHGIAGYLFAPDETVEVEGGVEVASVALGNSFQDVAQGVLTPQEPKSSVQPETTQTKTVAPIKALDQTAPVKTASHQATPLTALKPTPEKLPLVKSVALESAKPNAPEITKPLKIEKPEPLAKPEPQVIEADSLDNSPKPRPIKRPVQTPQKTAPKKKPAPKGQKQPKQVKGQTNGQKAATSATQSSAKTKATTQAGNAARSNYAGKVNRKITRVRRPKTRDRGTVKITFKIAPNGQLSTVRVSKSSGKASLDKAALDLVRRAAPFPKPPKGINLVFSKTFKFGK